jgi:hypothetical protein
MTAGAFGEKRGVSYFLISVSTRENLDLCIKYGLAGFPSGESGAWTYCEIEEGDFVSFLYGATAHNLYQVSKKEAIVEAEHLPPWKLLTFSESGKTYSFPFRLHLELIRTFAEPIARAEFFYVAENLLLRGGYRRTHFQADQTTLQNVSQMGTLAEGSPTALRLPGYTTFLPRFTRSRGLINLPQVCSFREPILQSAIRQYLASDSHLRALLSRLDFAGPGAGELEILGEKALAQGHIDLLLKERIPLGSSIKIPIEVKTKRGQSKDLAQIQGYMAELRGQCPMGVLIAADFGRQEAASAARNHVRLVRHQLKVDLNGSPTFEEICQGLTLEPL